MDNLKEEKFKQKFESLVNNYVEDYIKTCHILTKETNGQYIVPQQFLDYLPPDTKSAVERLLKEVNS
jgi:hypothetical protein